MTRVLQCVQFDEATQTCVVEAWVEDTGFPTLSTAAALEISQSAALLLCVCWIWKKLGQHVNR